jgi:predicted  nucleic acid-binding Zn-ribbon protein
MSPQGEKLLQYQEVDSKLLKIDQTLAQSDEYKKYASARNFLTKAQEQLDKLEGKAVELNLLLADLNKKYGEICETLKDFENLDELVEEGAEVGFYKKNALSIIEQLKSLRAEITTLTENIKGSDEEYKTLKKKTIAMQDQYKEYSAKFNELKAQKNDERSGVKKELDGIAKDISPEVLKKYSEKRSERIFPVICAVKNERCSKCGSEISLAGKEQLKGGKVIECENCHRFLYL